MDNIIKDLVFLLPEQDDFLVSENIDTNKLHNVVLFSKDFSDENKIQLVNILKAVHIDFETQVHLIALQENQTIRFTEIFQGGFLFCFGVNPNDLGFNIIPTQYEVNSFSQAKVLFSESLTTIRTQVESKKRLWSCLKSYFLD